MSDPQVLAPYVRLAVKARRPGGVGYAEAVTGAEAKLASATGRTLSRIDALVAKLTAYNRASDAETEVLKTIVDELAGLCGLVSRPELGALASIICGLVEADAGAHSGPSGAAISVHLDALRLFHALGSRLSAGKAQEVMLGLARIRSLTADNQ